MAQFRCVAIETEVASRFRLSGRDDRGSPIRRSVAASDHSAPCRHCLCYAGEGDTMLLASHDVPRPGGVYWAPSPVFIHADACARFDRPNVIASIVRRNSLVSIRAYDAEDLCLYDLGAVASADGVDAPLERALDDPRTAFINVHTARPGCWLCRVERI